MAKRRTAETPLMKEVAVALDRDLRGYLLARLKAGRSIPQISKDLKDHGMSVSTATLYMWMATLGIRLGTSIRDLDAKDPERSVYVVNER